MTTTEQCDTELLAQYRRYIAAAERLAELKRHRARRRWLCGVPGCDGEPHDGMHWCAHPIGGEHTPECRHARADQHPPSGEWDIWLYQAGRGSGKTRAAAEAVLDAVLEDRAHRIALVGRTPADVRDVMIGGPSGILACAERRGFTVGPHQDVWHISSMSRVQFDLGGRTAVALTFASTVPDALRGPNFDFAWADEPAAWEDAHLGQNGNTAWTNLRMALRLGERPRLLATTTPKRVALIRELMELPGVVRTQVPTAINARNLAPTYLSALEAAYGSTSLARQELAGELIEDVEGALWRSGQLDASRVYVASAADLDQVVSRLERIVVAVDPAGSADGDTCGIVVAGRRSGEMFVLADHSMRVAPAAWATEVARAVEKWGADRVIAEGNFGGSLVAETLYAHGVELPVELVHASRGKRPRAEPVAALSGDPARPETWGAGKLHIVGSLPELEDELCSWTDNDRESPGRLDALVWAAHGLGIVAGHGWEGVMAALTSTLQGRRPAGTVRSRPTRSGTRLP